MREMDIIIEATGMRPQELSRIVEDRMLWTSLSHRVTRSQNQLNNT